MTGGKEEINLSKLEQMPSRLIRNVQLQSINAKLIGHLIFYSLTKNYLKSYTLAKDPLIKYEILRRSLQPSFLLFLFISETIQVMIVT